MEWFAEHAEVWAAAGTWVTALVLGVTLHFVHRQVREATKLRRQQVRPYVVPAIDIEQQELAMLTLENIGATAATHVLLDIDPAPQSTIKNFASVHFVSDVTPTLPPGRKFRASWDLMTTVFDDDYPHPLRYIATVTYKDQDGRDYAPEQYVLDFNVFRGQALASPDLAREVKRLREEHERWRGPAGGGLRTYNIDGDRRDYLRERELLIRELRNIRRRDGWWAALKEIVRFFLMRRWLPVPNWVK